MPMYDAGGVFFDPILTNFSTGYQAADLIGRRLFPVTPTPLQAGKYRVFDRSNWLIFDDYREPGAVANEVRGRKWSEDNFYAKEHSLQAAVTDEEQLNLGNPTGNPANAALFAGIDPRADAVELITRAILLRHELDVANLARNAATYPGGNVTTLSGTSQWNDYTGVSDPITVIENARRTIFASIYKEPNMLVIPWTVWSYLRNHPKIVARVQYTSVSTVGAFQELTGFTGDIVIPTAVYNTADNVDATEAAAEIWGKDVILAVTESQPAMNTKCFGKTFMQPYPNGSLNPVDAWREEPRRSDLVRCSMKYDLKVVSNTAGYLIKNAVA